MLLDNPEDKQTSRRSLSGHGLVVTVGLITLAGAALRLAAARGDLWLDEIWSFRLLETVASASDIVLRLPNDNNHVLTTAWLAFVGPHAPPLLVRLPAVLCGALCAPVAARIGARIGTSAALAGAVIFAFDYGFVHYGSEARGYSGMILAVLVAYDALERMLDDNAPRRNQAIFALAVAFGTFSHLTMIEATTVFCAVGVLRGLQSEAWRMTGLRRARPVLVAALAGTFPALLCLGLSLSAAGVHTGLATPFSFAVFGEGLGRMARATLGLPDGPIDGFSAALLIATLGAVVILALAALPPRRRWFPGLAILGLPTLHAALHLSNQQYPRFHLTAAIALALLGAEIWARAFDREGYRRLAAVIAGAAFLVGHYAGIADFLTLQRGHFGEAVAFMSRDNPASYMVTPAVQAGETGAVIRWYAPSRGAHPLTRIDPATSCAVKPDWLLVVKLPNDADRPGVPANVASTTTAGPDDCPTRFAFARTFPAYGLSGFTWVVYRRD